MRLFTTVGVVKISAFFFTTEKDGKRHCQCNVTFDIRDIRDAWIVELLQKKAEIVFF